MKHCIKCLCAITQNRKYCNDCNPRLKKPQIKECKVCGAECTRSYCSPECRRKGMEEIAYEFRERQKNKKILTNKI